MSNGLGEYFGGASSTLDPRPTRTSVTQGPASLPATGEYFAQNGMGATAAGQPSGNTRTIGALGEYFAQSGLGATNYGPMRTRLREPGPFKKIARGISPAIGALGEAGDIIDQSKAGIVSATAAGAALTAILAGMAIRFGSGWLVGKALAPNRDQEQMYSWGGAIGTTLFGPIALGAEALIAANWKK